MANKRIVLRALQKDRGLSNKMIKQQFWNEVPSEGVWG